VTLHISTWPATAHYSHHSPSTYYCHYTSLDLCWWQTNAQTDGQTAALLSAPLTTSMGAE